MSFLSGFGKGFSKGFGGVFKTIGKGAKGLVNFGMSTAERVSSMPGRALGSNLEALGLDANTLLLYGGGALVLLTLLQRGGGGGRR
jgi:hypothetical protein